MITALVAIFMAVFNTYWVNKVATLRRSHKVGLGYGECVPLQKAIRVHGNSMEQAPLMLILLFLVEYHSPLPTLTAIVGATFCAARLWHAKGIMRTRGYSSGRFLGTAITLICQLILAAVLVTHFGAQLIKPLL